MPKHETPAPTGIGWQKGASGATFELNVPRDVDESRQNTKNPKNKSTVAILPQRRADRQNEREG